MESMKPAPALVALGWKSKEGGKMQS